MQDNLHSSKLDLSFVGMHAFGNGRKILPIWCLGDGIADGLSEEISCPGHPHREKEGRQRTGQPPQTGNPMERSIKQVKCSRSRVNHHGAVAEATLGTCLMLFQPKTEGSYQPCLLKKKTLRSLSRELFCLTYHRSILSQFQKSNEKCSCARVTAPRHAI